MPIRVLRVTVIIPNPVLVSLCLFLHQWNTPMPPQCPISSLGKLWVGGTKHKNNFTVHLPFTCLFCFPLLFSIFSTSIVPPPAGRSRWTVSLFFFLLFFSFYFFIFLFYFSSTSSGNEKEEIFVSPFPNNHHSISRKISFHIRVRYELLLSMSPLVQWQSRLLPPTLEGFLA